MGFRVRHVTTLLVFRACRSSWRNCNDQLYSKLHVSMTKTLSWEKKSAHDDDGELLQKIQLQCSSVAWLVVVFMGLWSEDRRLLWPSSPSFFFVGSGIVRSTWFFETSCYKDFDDVKNLSIECNPKMTFLLASILDCNCTCAQEAVQFLLLLQCQVNHWFKIKSWGNCVTM